MKKILLGLVTSSILVTSLFSSTLTSQKNGFELQKQEKMHNQTSFRNMESVKLEQKRIKEILVKFEILEDSLTGFEDKLIVNRVKNEFKNKYLITNSDLILINTKINQEIKIKQNKK